MTETTWPIGVAGTYWARYEDLPASELLQLVVQIRDHLREGEDLDLELTDGVLGAVVLYLRDSDQSVSASASQIADSDSDVSGQVSHGADARPTPSDPSGEQGKP